MGNKLCCLSHPVYDGSVLAVLNKILSSNQANSDLNMETVFLFFFFLPKFGLPGVMLNCVFQNDILIFLTPSISECGRPLWFSW